MMKPSCKCCGICCTVHSLHFSNVNYDAKWVEGRNGVIKGMDVFLPSRCKWLTKDNKCEVQDDKPEFCKLFPNNVGPQAWLMNMGCRYFE